jgi:exodeoxyribonuclease V alpha subunit
MQVQILAPMYRGVAGVDNLNPVVQDVFNGANGKKRKQVEIGTTVYRIGDKVLQLVNNPDKNVFNGEIGTVTGIDIGEKNSADSLTLDFDGNEISYARGEWNKITLAYATSIHKAQGSEFDMVILPLTLQSRRMLKRNLVYTAITRAKRFLILVGEPAAFELAAQTLAANRKTGLQKRLRAAFSLEADEAQTPASTSTKSTGQTNVAASKTTQAPITEKVATSSDTVAEDAPAKPQSYILTNELIASGKISPLIGMDGITPQKLMEEAQ